MEDLEIKETTTKDLYHLWKIRNEPNIRNKMFDKRFMRYSYYLKIFNKFKGYFFTIKKSNNLIGCLTFKKITMSNVYDIGIFIKESHQNQNIGYNSINMGIDYIKDQSKKPFICMALIEQKNIKSQKLFDKLGFKQSSNLLWIKEIKF